MTTESTSSVSIVLAGSGGAGVMTAGTMLLDAAGRAGYYALMTRSSGPQIRGGEAAAMVRIATHPVESHVAHRPLRPAARHRLAERRPLRRRDPDGRREPDAR
jgi:2-oxoglutarate ferredoxin oxidoreductase subunit alpha